MIRVGFVLMVVSAFCLFQSAAWFADLSLAVRLTMMGMVCFFAAFGFAWIEDTK